MIVTGYLMAPESIADAALTGGIDGLVVFTETVVAHDADVAERAKQGIGSRAFVQSV
jgi:hypothetical protein